jgi:hypothetical protein
MFRLYLRLFYLCLRLFLLDCIVFFFYFMVFLMGFMVFFFDFGMSLSLSCLYRDWFLLLWFILLKGVELVMVNFSAGIGDLQRESVDGSVDNKESQNL